jgi:hypothetical protein
MVLAYQTQVKRRKEEEKLCKKGVNDDKCKAEPWRYTNKVVEGRISDERLFLIS